MSEQSDDYNEALTPVDEKVVGALKTADRAVQDAIRRDIGDEAYAAFMERRKTREQFDEMTEEIAKTPLQVVGERAAEIARAMTDADKGISSSIDRAAMAAAHREWMEARDREDDAYYEAALEIEGKLAQQLELELSMHYSGIHLVQLTETWLSLEIPGNDGVTLRIVIDTGSGSPQFLGSYVRPVNGIPKVIATLDLEAGDGAPDGIILPAFKEDVAHALGTIPAYLDHSGEQEESEGDG